MSQVTIALSELETAATKAAGIAVDMGDYASDLLAQVRSPLASVTGGANDATRTVRLLAYQKAQDLCTRAQNYESLASDISEFVEEARAADERVASSISAISYAYVADGSYSADSYWSISAISGAVGTSELASSLSDLYFSLDYAGDWAAEKLDTALNWFDYGDGSYYAQIGLSALEAVSTTAMAYATVGGASAALAGLGLAFPVGTIAAAAVAIVGGVAIAKSVTDLASTTYGSATAIVLNDTNPSYAYYRGDVSSISDLVKQTSTDATTQGIATAYDVSGEVANLALDTLNLARIDTDSIASLDSARYSFSWETVRKNLLGNLCLSEKADGSISIALDVGTVFGLNSLDGLGFFTNAEKVWTVTDVMGNVISALDAGFGVDAADLSDVHDKALTFAESVMGNLDLSLVDDMRNILETAGVLDED